MAPFVRPMKAMLTKYAGPFSKLTISHASSSATSSSASAGITYEPYERRSRAGASVWAWVAIRFCADDTGGGSTPPPVSVRTVALPLPAHQARGRDGGLDRVEVRRGLPVSRDRREGRVAGLAYRGGAETAVGRRG